MRAETRELEGALAALEDVPGCRVGLCVRGLEGPLVGMEVGVREDEALPGASLIKVLILAELLRRVDAGELSLEDTASVTADDLVADSEEIERLSPPAALPLLHLAEAMITVSDNAATNVLIRLLGFGPVNALAGSLGLSRTALVREMMDLDARARGRENLTSARDMAALLAALWSRELLSEESGGIALGMLGRQRREPPLPVRPPAHIRFAYKTGELDGVSNAAGLALAKGREYAMAVLVHGDAERAEQEVGAAARKVHAILSGSGEPIAGAR